MYFFLTLIYIDVNAKIKFNSHIIHMHCIKLLSHIEGLLDLLDLFLFVPLGVYDRSKGENISKNHKQYIMIDF